MKRVFVLAGVCFCAFANAQEVEYWADVNIYKNVNSKLSVFGDAGPRWNATGNPYGFYARPSISYRVSNYVTVNGGGAWFYSKNDNKPLNELRGWQGTRLEWQLLNRLMFSNFIRLEERWFFAESSSDFLLRFRWLAGLVVPLNNKTLEANTWYTPLAIEAFEDLNDHETIFINRTRVYGGIGYVLNKDSRMELFYIANNSRKSTEEDFELVNVFRLRFHFTIPERPVLID